MSESAQKTAQPAMTQPAKGQTPQAPQVPQMPNVKKMMLWSMIMGFLSSALRMVTFGLLNRKK
jgi:hypothetical protein